MDKVIIFYIDKYNRKIDYTCTTREFKAIAIILLEKLANHHDLSYTYKDKTDKLDYYNLDEIKL